jgi:hypothetical protein
VLNISILWRCLSCSDGWNTLNMISSWLVCCDVTAFGLPTGREACSVQCLKEEKRRERFSVTVSDHKIICLRYVWRAVTFGM